MFMGCPFVSPGVTLIRTRTLRDAGGFNESIWGTDDYDLWLRLVRQGHLIVEVPKVALWYKRHPTNSSANALRIYENCERMFRNHLTFLPARDRSLMVSRVFQRLYEHFGERAVMSCKEKLRKGDASDMVRVAGLVMRLVAVTYQERIFFKRICRDVFVPARFHAPKPNK